MPAIGKPPSTSFRNIKHIFQELIDDFSKYFGFEIVLYDVLVLLEKHGATQNIADAIDRKEWLDPTDAIISKVRRLDEWRQLQPFEILYLDCLGLFKRTKPWQFDKEAETLRLERLWDMYDASL